MNSIVFDKSKSAHMTDATSGARVYHVCYGYIIYWQIGITLPTLLRWLGITCTKRRVSMPVSEKKATAE